MHRRVWKSAFTLTTVMILNEGGKGVELARGGVPPDENFFGVGP